MSARIFEYRPSDEAIVVDRILQHVHRCIDAKLPNADKAPDGFCRPVFSEDEATAVVKSGDRAEPHDDAGATPNEDGSASEGEQSPSSDEAELSQVEDFRSFTTRGDLDTRLSSGFFDLTAVRYHAARRRRFFVKLAIVILVALAAAYWYVFVFEKVL